MHARYYSPGIDRFLSLDLLGGHPRHPQSWNRDAYVLNNPLTYIDPFGLAVECVVKGGSGDDGEEGDEEIVCTESERVDVIEEEPKEPTSISRRFPMMHSRSAIWSFSVRFKRSSIG